MGRIPIWALIPPLVFGFLAGLFFWGLGRENPDELPSTMIGRPAPELRLEPIDGLPPIPAAALSAPGVKLVNFWASWCAPCRAEHPNLVALAKSGVKIWGVNYKDDPAKARAFLAELGNPFAGVEADPGRNAIEWGVYGVPETFVIDGKGVIRLRFAGPITTDALRTRILPAIEAARQGE